MEGLSSGNHYKDDRPCPPGLESLKVPNLFIVQQNICGGWFRSNKTYEIRDDKKQLLFKGNQGSSGVCRKFNDKVILTNLRRRKIILLEFDSSGYCGKAAEATISSPVDIPIGRIIKYGGVYAPPSFEIVDSDNEVIFSAEAKQNGGVGGGLEYPIKTPSGLVAHVAMKSGLNLGRPDLKRTKSDMLKHGKLAAKKNEYEFPG